jgi:hypothetical protein
MTRLSKRQVEQLLASLDTDQQGALTAALRIVLDRPGDAWSDLIGAAPLPPAVRASLLAGDLEALDTLTARLIEDRSL